MVIFLYEKSHNKYYVIIKEQFLISERFLWQIQTNLLFLSNNAQCKSHGTRRNSFH